MSVDISLHQTPCTGKTGQLFGDDLNNYVYFSFSQIREPSPDLTKNLVGKLLVALRTV